MPINMFTEAFIRVRWVRQVNCAWSTAEDFERLFAVLKRVISFTLNVKARKFCFSRKAVSRLRLHRGLHYLSSLLCYLKTSFLSGNQEEEMIQQNETKRAKPPKWPKQNDRNKTNLTIEMTKRPIWPKYLHKITRGGSRGGHIKNSSLWSEVKTTFESYVLDVSIT